MFLIVTITSYFVIYALNNNAFPGLKVGYNVVVDDNLAFVSNNEGIEIINVESKYNPKVLGNVDVDNMGFGFAVNGNQLYIADSTSGIIITDIQDPNNYRIIGETNFDIGVLSLDYQDNLVYTINTKTMRIVNVSIPENPELIGTYTSPLVQDYRDIFIHSDLLFIADGSRGVDIINITNPNTPTLITTVLTEAPIALHVHENILFTGCHGAGIKWFDISIPNNPYLLGSYMEPNGEAYGVWGNSSHIYVADLQKGVYALSIIGLVSKLFYNLDAHPHDIIVENNFVYLGDQDFRLKIFGSELNCLYNGHVDHYGLPIFLTLVLIIIYLYPVIKRKFGKSKSNKS
ncbi:MAG: hypothetical protein INQ03_13465 [Candidatus Heimdallarchaeota archaeon]|nr:hypothetical protein [Candidatus Heimdallarchaeota archaeon]